MRKIKFRAWYTQAKKYIPVISIHNNGTCTLQNSVQGYYTGEFKNCVIEQFTGLHDKNGKECYIKDWVDDGINPPFLVTDDYHLLARLSEIEFTIRGNEYEGIKR